MAAPPPANKSRLKQAMGAMPKWKKILFGFSLGIALVGVGAQIAIKYLWKPEPAGQTTSVDGGGNVRGFVHEDGSSASVRSEEPEATWLRRSAPWLTRIAVGVFIGLCLGLMLRTFLKTTAVIIAVAVVALVALSYFNIINLDFSTMKTNYDNASQWVSDQASRFKDLIVAQVPSLISAAAGFFIGFRK